MGGGKLVIIDDGSKDNTYSIMKECQCEMPDFIALTKENSGHGATVLFGYQYALSHHADYIFQTDSDGQTLPEEFEQFWRQRHTYDMIIGYRRNREDGLSRKFVTKVLKLTIRMCFGVKVSDANTPFRLMKADTLRENIGLIPKDYNLSNVIIAVIYEKKKLAVKYIPITFRSRQGGANSINFMKIVTIGIAAVKDFKMINQIIKGDEKNA